MQPHPNLNLLVHSTNELEYLLGERIAAREQMHAWPLSCVELITTAAGKRLVYKVQREPTVEPEFFARASTTLLPACTILQRDAQQAAVLFPFLEAPTLRDQPLDEATFVAHGRAIVEQIGQIGGDVPVHVDLGTAEAWRLFANQTLEMLSALVQDGIFTQITRDDIERLAHWVQAGDIIDAIEHTSQLINADLKAEHIFCTPDGYQIIDWQRPYRAPGEIDLVLLLDSRQIPAQRYIAPAIIGLRWFLFLHWSVEAKTNLLPHLPFLGDWVRLGIDKIQSVRNR
jgi:hypothetical protein